MEKLIPGKYYWWSTKLDRSSKDLILATSINRFKSDHRHFRTRTETVDVFTPIPNILVLFYNIKLRKKKK